MILIVLLLFFAPSFSWARGGGGCLAEGTPVLTPQGSSPIQNLKVGDGVTAIAGGKPRIGRVLSRMEVQADTFLEITAPAANLRITSEHPVMVGQGAYLLAKLLNPGDRIYSLADNCLSPYPSFRSGGSPKGRPPIISWSVRAALLLLQASSFTTKAAFCRIA